MLGGLKLHYYLFVTVNQYREIASKHSFIDKFEVIFHYGNGKDETLDEEIKTEIVHLYSDVYLKNGKPYIYDTKRNRYVLSCLSCRVLLL